MQFFKESVQRTRIKANLTAAVIRNRQKNAAFGMQAKVATNFSLWTVHGPFLF